MTVLLILLVIWIVFLIFTACQRFVRGRLGSWLCRELDWHVPPIWMSFDSCSLTGECNRCHRRVFMDSHGNWFKL